MTSHRKIELIKWFAGFGFGLIAGFCIGAIWAMDYIINLIY
jgi:hypothetical protein